MYAAEDLRHAKVGDLELAAAGEQQVLELDVAVGDAVAVQIVDAAEQLLEQTQSVLELEVVPEQALLHECVQLAGAAVLHDVVPAAAVRAQPDRVHDVGVVQALGYAVLGLDLLDVLVLVLARFLASELLDGVQLLARSALADHELDRRRRAFADRLAPATRQQAGALELLVELAVVDEELVGQAGAEPTSLETGSLGGVLGEGSDHADAGIVRVGFRSRLGYHLRARGPPTDRSLGWSRGSASHEAGAPGDAGPGSGSGRVGKRGDTLVRERAVGAELALGGDGARGRARRGRAV